MLRLLETGLNPMQNEALQHFSVTGLLVLACTYVAEGIV